MHVVSRQELEVWEDSPTTVMRKETKWMSSSQKIKEVFAYR